MATAQDYSLRKKVFAASWIVIFVAAGISAYSVFKASIMEATGGDGQPDFHCLHHTAAVCGHTWHFFRKGG